jgi:hypothetical protein
MRESASTSLSFPVPHARTPCPAPPLPTTTATAPSARAGNFDLDPEDDPLRVVFNVILRVYGVDEVFDMAGFVECTRRCLEVLVDTWKRYAPAFLNVVRKGRPGAASVRAVEGGS